MADSFIIYNKMAEYILKLSIHRLVSRQVPNLPNIFSVLCHKINKMNSFCKMIHEIN